MDIALGLCIVSEQIPSLVFLAYCWPCYHSCVNPICPSLVTHSVALCCLQLHLLFLFQHKLSAVILLLCFSLSTMLVASCYCLGKIDYLMLITWVKQLLVFSCLKHNSIYSFFGLKSGRFRCIVGLKTVGLIHCLLLEKNDANPDFPLHTSFCEPTTKVIVICNRRIWPMTELLSSEALAITWFLPKRLMMMFWPKKQSLIISRILKFNYVLQILTRACFFVSCDEWKSDQKIGRLDKKMVEDEEEASMNATLKFL